jgi:hypothetical protein
MRNPWKNPDDLSHTQVAQLEDFVAALHHGKGFRECCLDAFGTEETWRKCADDVLRAAIAWGFLRVDLPREDKLAQRLKSTFRLRSARVVAADSTVEPGRRRLAFEAAKFFLQRVRELQETVGSRVDIAVGGGRSVHYILQALRPALKSSEAELGCTEGETHLWTPTVGFLQQAYERAPHVHLVDCASKLGIPAASIHMLPELPKFEGAAKISTYRHLPRVQNHVKDAETRVKLVLTSCGAGEDNDCLKWLKEQHRGPLPKRMAGEFLFNLYDERGEAITDFAPPVFTVFPGNEIPRRIANADRPRGRAFRVLGFIYGKDSEEANAKARALRSAISNPESRWLTDVICTADIAKAVLGEHR